MRGSSWRTTVKHLLCLLSLAMGAETAFGQVREGWVARYSGENWEGSRALVVDEAGYVYVTGWSEKSDVNRDFVTVKYDPSGRQVWMASYDGPAGWPDYPVAIAVDEGGNVYVTGESDGSVTSQDYATIKYDAGGNLLWVSRYNSPPNNYDSPVAIAVDGAGSVYVTGRTYALNTRDDYLTVKYDAQGNLIWVAQYDGPQHDADYPYGIAVDGSGNAYVTGSSYAETPTDRDCVTIKYGATGNELWRATYNGPANGGDWGSGITLDGEGNICVTGTSWGGAETGDDYITVKYDPEGNALWVARYDGPDHYHDGGTALTLGAEGQIYVTGRSGNSGGYSDYATVAYDADGSELWAARYNGPADGTDEPVGIRVDGQGSVYVAGTSRGQGTGDDYALVKYGPQGNFLWVARYDDPSSDYEITVSLGLDGEGNAIVAGSSFSLGSYMDYATVKYDPQGAELWVAWYMGPGFEPDDDLAVALAVDRGGKVAVTGSRRYGGPSDYITIQYDERGNERWAARYFGPGGVDEARAVGVDSSGSVIVTGGSQGSLSTDYATVKYDRDGKQLWVARYEGPVGTGMDFAYALTVGPAGDIYVTGESAGSGTSADYATIRYGPGGNTYWISRYDGASSGYDVPVAVAVDGGGNVYVTGSSLGSGTDLDYTTVKYNSNGEELWVARYDGPGSVSDIAHDLAVDAGGNAYVTGESAGMGTSWDYATIKYDPQGNELWVARYNGPGNDYDGAASLTLDGSGGVCVSGQSYNSSLNRDFATLSYDREGNQLWDMRYEGPGGGTDVPQAIGVDGSGAVWVTGWSEGTGTEADYATIKYGQGPVGIGSREPEGNPLPPAALLLQNSPNPFNPSTLIRYSVPAGGSLDPGAYSGIPGEAAGSGQAGAWSGVEVTLRIFNLRGQRVATLVRERQGPGHYSVLWDGTSDPGIPVPSGIYFYRLEVGAFAATRKMIVLK